MILLVSYKIKPLINKMNAAETVNDRTGIWKKYAAIPAKNATTIPAVKKPDKKLKSFCETSA